MAIILLSLGLGACAHSGETFAERGEARLASLIEGRVAGMPQSCITVFSDERLTVIDETAVVYDQGKVIWVARPGDERSLRSDDILVVERTGSQLCKQDVVRTVDRTGGFLTGLVFLGDFVPYRRADD
jgi:hypothetical protein